MIERLRARDEWKFFGVLPQADRVLAIAWWTVLVLRGLLPASFAIARHRSQQVSLAAASRAVEQEWRGMAAGMAHGTRCQLERRLV